MVQSYDTVSFTKQVIEDAAKKGVEGKGKMVGWEINFVNSEYVTLDVKYQDAKTKEFGSFEVVLLDDSEDDEEDIILMPVRSLDDCRAEAAEKAFVDYEFMTPVEDTGAWQYVPRGGYWSRRVFCADPDGGDSIALTFVVRFEEGKDVVVDAYVAA